MNTIRKSLLLLISVVLFAGHGYLTPTIAATPAPSDIPQVFITTSETIGRDSYAPAEITILDSKGSLFETIHDPSAKIKVRGNSTAMLAKQPFNLKLDTAQSVLGMPAGKKWSLLANYLDLSLMRNNLSYDFAKDIGLRYSCESRYVDVWLNGSYNGNYLITVPVEAGENRVDINTDENEYLLELSVGRVEEGVTYLNTNIHRFEMNEPESLTQEQMAWLTTYLFQAESAITSGDFNEIIHCVDVASFIDFFIVQELFKNIDANTSSIRFYIKDNVLYAGPLWDMDLSAGNVSTYPLYGNYLTYNNCGEYGNRSGNSYEGLWALNQDMEGPSSTIGPSWIGHLMNCPEFRTKLYQRYLDLQEQIVNLYSDNALGEARMDALLKNYGSAFSRDNQKWPANIIRSSELNRTEETNFDDSVSFLRNFLEERNRWLLANMIPKDLPPETPAPPVYKMAESTNATVYVNGSHIAFDAYNIEGNNFFKLRDLSMAVADSSKQFEVEWNEDIRAINLISNKRYTPVGGEFGKGVGGKTQSLLWTSAIYKDQKPVRLAAYNINGNNYFKLRDVAELFDIGIAWNPYKKTIEINTANSYETL